MSYQKQNDITHDKNLVFAEYFSSEQETRRNGGISTDVTFEKGVATFGGDTTYIDYGHDRNIGEIYSIRIKGKRASDGSLALLNTAGSDYIGDLAGKWYHRSGGSSRSTTISPTDLDSDTEYIMTVDGADYILYINGMAAHSSSTVAAGGFEFRYIGYTNTNSWHGEMELVEIYNKALTQEEVTNLYNDARYKVPELEHPAQGGGTDLNVSDCENLSYTGFSNVTSTGFNAVSDGLITQVAGTADEIILTSGQRYLVSFNMVLNNGTAPEFDLSRFLGSSSYSVEGAQIAQYGFNEFVFTCQTSTGGVVHFTNFSTVANYEISNLKVQNLAVEPTSKILHVTARDGVCRNLLSGDDGGIEYESDFSVDIDGWDGYINSTSSANNDIYGRNNVLKATATGVASTPRIRKDNFLTIGKQYRFILDVYVPVENDAPDLNVYNGNVANALGVVSSSNEWQTIVYEFTAIDDQVHIAWHPGFVGIGDVFYIAKILITEIIPEVQLTDVEVVKDSPGYVPRVGKASNAKIDCGDYNDLTGDITILAWVNSAGAGGGSQGRIIDNSKFILRLGSTRAIAVMSNGSTVVFGDSKTDLQTYAFIAVRRTASGDTYLYKNGVLDTNLDGDTTGTPEAGTTNILVGNQSAGSRNWAGKLPETIILSGLLTSTEISAYYTATKHKFSK